MTAPPGQAAPRGDHRRGAGARAAGERDHRRRAPRPASGCVARSITCTNSTLVRSGNSGSCSIRGADARRGRPPRRPSTTKTQCGLPMPTAPGRPVERQRVDVHLAGQRHLVPAQLRRAHVDADQAVAGVLGAQRRRVRCAGRARVAPVSSISSRATQRVALPQAAAREPSAFQKSIADVRAGAVARSPRAGRSRRRGGGRRARARARASPDRRPPRASITTKSLPSPCIFRKRRPCAAGLRFAIHAPLYRDAGAARP